MDDFEPTPIPTPLRNDPRPGKAGFVIGTIFWIAFLGFGFQDGFYDWVVMELFMFTILVGLIPGISEVPLIGRMQHDMDKLIDLYRKKPHLLNLRSMIWMLIPGINLIFIIRQLAMFIPIFIVGVPIDIAMEATTQFVLQLPQWGKAATQSFGETIVYEIILTAITAPYLMFCALGVRPMLKGFRDA